MALLQSMPADFRVCITNVHVSLAAHRGWDVTATVDGRVIAIHHCNDWHRVEYLCSQLRGQRKDAMKPAHRAIQRPETCRWSVPACRPNPMSDRESDFESFWTCERTGTTVVVTADDCGRCAHWSP